MPADLPGNVIAPNKVRINGIPLLVTGDGIQVHEMRIGGAPNVATVTLTLLARRITVAAEGNLE
ncbi:hypothetical protein [uncultured Thermomonospora sp.]|uniref:hypothetical protein n=1 Tax=uncultured Thermomonospora sp. TaxID=671175 RepID=UPI00259BBEAF|nr:hypothetical protein [uncultured Thermomonospora sp.]